jgi:hypothetical protein
MEVVQELFGDRFNDATEENFRLLWEFCTETMIGAMGTPPPPPTPDPAPAAAEPAETAKEDVAAEPTQNGVEEGDTEEGEEPNRI